MTQKQQQIKKLLQQLDAELLAENPTLQDLHALYKSLFLDDPLEGVAPEQRPWRWTDKMQPEALLALLERSANMEGKVDEFEQTLREASECQSTAELKAFLNQTAAKGLHPAAASLLLFAAAQQQQLLLPAAPCSYKAPNF
ncbi:hypothetical protein, conserved, partial [Eimeria tenella]